MSIALSGCLSAPLSIVNECPWLSTFLLLVGTLTFTRFAIKTVLVFAQTFVLPGKNLKHFGAKKGSWAVITGASDGIGREFALQLARKGFNILLVARNNGMLTAVAEEIASKYGPSVETKIHLIDFSKKDEAAYEGLKSAMAELDIGILVNCVGKSHTMPTYFVEVPTQDMDDIVAININATMRVTSLVLPGMIQRKRGLILNLGSFAGSIPSPMLAPYSASKAFLSTFSSALQEEVKTHNIVVHHLNTYFVVSKMSNIRRASLFVPLPADYVRSALSKISLSCGAVLTDRPGTLTPYWSHAILDYLIHAVGIKSLFISYTHGLHKSIRKRALRKLERESKKQ